MNQTTIEEVTRLLNDAPYASYIGEHVAEVRRGALLEDRTEDKITVVEYVQLMDALNTHLEIGSYEGCLIWRNAEANPLEEQQNG